MKTLNTYLKQCLQSTPKSLLIVFTSLVILGGCASSPKSPDGAVAAREKLTRLQNDPSLAKHVSVAIRNADLAVRAAETPRKDKAESDHLVFIATREVDIALAQAQTRHLEDQRDDLKDARDTERLDSRTREADLARNSAEQARAETEELRRQMAELNAKTTERGLVVTLGDMLFETGKSDLKGNARENLAKLSSFLNKYADRNVLIEGHTDSVGSEESNLSLSQRRADAVRFYLAENGVGSNRMTSFGKGENQPVASNDSVSGRALNRRVEVIIMNPGVPTQ